MLDMGGCVDCTYSVAASRLVPMFGAPSGPDSCDWESVLSSHNLIYVISKC